MSLAGTAGGDRTVAVRFSLVSICARLRRRKRRVASPLGGLPAHQLRDLGLSMADVGYADCFGRLPSRPRRRPAKDL
jgi:uncharacterized protein YjiS (DUF1127 family)